MRQTDTTPRLIVNDVTRLNPVPIWAVTAPTSIEEVQSTVRRTEGSISVGGGHFSMGGQTASPNSLHMDMRQLNKVIAFHPQQRSIHVEAGARWCDIQRFIDPHDLSVSIMQTYANFTVGGSLSVNVHGRYIGLGPLILSVSAIRLVLADGSLIEASPDTNSNIFYGAIGGYGALGVIVEAELELANNLRLRRDHRCLATSDYACWFREKIRNDSSIVFHNADLYPPHFRRTRAVSWRETGRAATVTQRLQPNHHHYPLHRLFFWLFSETRSGKWYREHLLDPLLYSSHPVHWRNYEAGYDVAELEPASRKHSTYVLQEYFIPVARFDDFTHKMTQILTRHRVNVINVSVRHALPDSGSLLAWAREEVFAFVLYYKQRTRTNAKERVAIWSRELIDAALDCGGTWYLPYQPHATIEQFHRGYPRAHELFALKRQLDPDYRWRNRLWDTYYQPDTVCGEKPLMSKLDTAPTSDFHAIYGFTRGSDDFYLFLQNIYHLYPEDRFHTLIHQICREQNNDESIYRALQIQLPTIKPFLSDLTYALPALGKQKREMTRQTLELLGERRHFDGYLEIGSTGRYIGHLRHHLTLKGELILINDTAPSNSPVDIIERGRLRKLGRFLPLNDYAPISPTSLTDTSIELATCYIGLHHAPLDRLNDFIASLARVIKPGGLLILRDHDVNDDYMRAMASLAHTVFNAGLGTAWEVNAQELRHFRAINDWVNLMATHGFAAEDTRLLQDKDPTRNVLLSLRRL